MPLDIREINQKVQNESVFLAELRKELSQVIVGQEEMVDRLLVGLLARGHIFEHHVDFAHVGSVLLRLACVGEDGVDVGAFFAYEYEVAQRAFGDFNAEDLSDQSLEL